MNRKYVAIVAVLLVLGMLIGLFGCSGGDTDADIPAETTVDGDTDTVADIPVDGDTDTDAAAEITVEEKIAKAISAASERIAEYRQNEAAFADTLMYCLPDSCVYDSEGGFLIHYAEENYFYDQKLTKADGEYKFYSDTEAALDGDNEAGQTVYTLGYHKAGDGGCARYTVADVATDEIYIEKNGVYLNYSSALNKVSVLQMGWKDDGLNIYQNQFEKLTKINTWILPKGEYAAYDVMRTDRDGVNYFGIEATVYTAENFGGAKNKYYDTLWNVTTDWDRNKIIVGQTYSDIRFEMRTKKYNEEIAGLKGLNQLMMLAYCDGINLYNCSFYVPQGLYDGDLKNHVSDCFDCFTDWRNVTIEGCSFENYSYANAGGAVGFRDINNKGCENLIFRNNTVVSSVRDEGVALFAGLDKLLKPEAPLGNGYIKNCLLENNAFKALESAEGLAPRTMFLTVGYQLSPVYDIKYLNNTFDGYCNSYFLHYCYCKGLTFKGNTVNIRQSGEGKEMTLIRRGDSPDASDIVVENNVFNLSGENFKLHGITSLSEFSDMKELTFKNNVVNLNEGRAETLVGSDATLFGNKINIKTVGSIYYRTNGDVHDNVYDIEVLEKSVYEFYNADVKHDLTVKKESISVKTMKSNILMFNGTAIKFNGHSLLFEDVNFDIEKIDRQYFYLAWSSECIVDTAVSVTFRNSVCEAFEGHMTIPNGDKHKLFIE